MQKSPPKPLVPVSHFQITFPCSLLASWQLPNARASVGSCQKMEPKTCVQVQRGGCISLCPYTPWTCDLGGRDPFVTSYSFCFIPLPYEMWHVSSSLSLFLDSTMNISFHYPQLRAHFTIIIHLRLNNVYWGFLAEFFVSWGRSQPSNCS
jgi:hypothetical protein